ncbi:MAG TPA: c-type cytochrome [Rhodocyclaceae bacterium]|jgi:cytochrome c|nr:c-type cytochrome [Rhodocyclaceae bacterium]
MKNALLISVLVAIGLAPAAQASEALASKAGCMACHAKDKKLVGPAFKDVSAKYKDQKDVDAKLFDKVRKGGAGNWGPIPMSANGPDKISDADLKTVITWILKGAA